MEEKGNYNVNISIISIIRVLMFLLLVWFLFAIRDILLLLLISIVISSAMDPLADYLNKHHIPRALCVLLVYIVFLGFFGLMIYLLVPPIADQFQQISQSDFVDDLNSKLGFYKENLDRFGITSSLQENIKSWSSTLSASLFDTTRGIITGIFSTLSVLVISFYLTVEENGMKNLIRQLTPYKSQAYAMTLISKIQKKMGAWVLGQFILSIIIFGLTYLGLTVLKVEYALVLALIAGALEIIPYIGPFIALIPAVFFAFIQNPPLALAVIVLYIIIQQLENHIIVPVVMSKSVGLNPILVIVGILVGSALGGVVGAVLAVPVLSGVAIFVQDMWGNEAT